MSPEDVFRVFILAIFYVGKGKRSRPYAHLNEAMNSAKVHRDAMRIAILDIKLLINDNIFVLSNRTSDAVTNKSKEESFSLIQIVKNFTSSRTLYRQFLAVSYWLLRRSSLGFAALLNNGLKCY